MCMNVFLCDHHITKQSGSPSQMGLWCSGITFALHAKGLAFDPPLLHFFLSFFCISLFKPIKVWFQIPLLVLDKVLFLLISSYSKVPRMFQLLLLRLPRSQFPRTRLSDGSGEAINPHIDAFVIAPTLEIRCISNIPYETWTPRLYSFQQGLLKR